MATIRINDLRLRAIIGTHPWERKNRQDLILNLVIEYDAAKASKSDRLKDALDYEVLTDRVTRLVETSRYYLLEKLTTKVLEAVAKADPRVSGAWVRLEKPHALAQARSVSFELCTP